VSGEAHDDGRKAWLAGVFDRAAPTYDRVGEAYHDHFGTLLVAAAGIRPGGSVLDVACGRGAALIPAARRAAGGRVLGVDLSPAMVAAAVTALAEAGLAAEVTEMDAEHLALDDASFDVALCAFGLFFFPDPEAAVAEVRRVVRPGGAFALSTWGEEDRRWDWEHDLLARLDVERRAVVRPFDRAEDIESLLVAAGFDDVSCTVAQHEVHFADADAWWAGMWSYSLRGTLEQQDERTLDRLRHGAAGHLRALESDSGLPYLLSANLVRARRPVA